MKSQNLQLAAALAATLIFASCEPPKAVVPESEAKKEAAKPAEPIAAKAAFFSMYRPARAWAPDLLALSLASDEAPELANEGGKAAKWTAVFVSPSKREARTFFYSAVGSGKGLNGVTEGGSQPWSGPTLNSRPFQITEFNIDSDTAFRTALEKAQPWLKKNPGKSWSMLLSSQARFPAPAWYVLWGDHKSGFDTLVNASNGTVIIGKK